MKSSDFTSEDNENEDKDDELEQAISNFYRKSVFF